MKSKPLITAVVLVHVDFKHPIIALILISSSLYYFEIIKTVLYAHVNDIFI